MPTIVQIRNWNRSAANTPPLETRSPIAGYFSPAPFEPLAASMPVEATAVPAVAPSIVAKSDASP